MDRLDGMETAQADSSAALDGRVTAVEMAQGTADGRLTDLEGLADGHNTRLAKLELWRTDRAAAVAKINAASMPSINVLGINVLSADNVRTVANKVDTLIDRLVDREIIEYST